MGPSALLVEVADHLEALSLAVWLRERRAPVVEIVPAACTVLLDGVDHPEQLVPLLDRWPGTGVPELEGESIEVPVSYDGDDLDVVARHWGTDRHGVISRHTGVEFVVAFCGFAPGFSYLAGLPETWALGRLDSPRAQVPAGSVALAGQWCGIYPTTSPGGWLLLGRTELKVWDLNRAGHPSLLPPGTRVRFVVA